MSCVLLEYHVYDNEKIFKFSHVGDAEAFAVSILKKRYRDWDDMHPIERDELVDGTIFVHLM